MKMYSMEDYNKAINLRNKGFTLDKISKILSIPSGTIYFWSKGALPLQYSNKHRESSIIKIRKFNETSRRLREEKYNELKSKITPDFAFSLGSILGDGCISIRKRDSRNMGQICLITKDKDYAMNFRDSIEKWSQIKCKLIFYRNVWNVWSYSLVVARCFKDFDLSKLFSLDDKIKSSFLKGIFDAEGSVDVKSKKIIFTNTSKNIIKLVENILESFEIKSKVYVRRSKVRFIEGRKLLPSSYFVIQISSKEGLKLFYEKIGFSIKRKNDKLKNIISSYKSL
jgi:intein-encoded DNA endonuclease-like protein